MTQMLNAHQIRHHPVFAWRLDMEYDMRRFAVMVLFRIRAKCSWWDYLILVDDQTTGSSGRKLPPKWLDTRSLAAQAAATFLRKITTR